jgi:hypothetical protein
LGLFDVLLGGSRKLKTPAPDRLFAITTAQITLQSSLGLESKNKSGIVFQPLETADFNQIVDETQQLLESQASESHTAVQTHDDDFGYRWITLNNPDFDELVVALNMVSTQLQSGGYGDRLLCCVFAFQNRQHTVYFIYNFKRGSFYPFVPAGGRERDTESELRLKSQLSSELPIEAELERWYPLWDIPL